MKLRFFTLLSICLVFFVLGCKATKTMVDKQSASEQFPDVVLAFQEELNDSYLNSKDSPISAEQRVKLKENGGHNFFPIDSTFRVTAKWKTFDNPKMITMPTSSSRMAEYYVYGELSFELKGKPVKLKVYRSKRLMAMPEYADYLFLPFKDLTSGKETYGAGRYIDLRIPEAERKTMIVDFNQAYQPYCAYAKGYSCPVPPAENFIDLQITAGVMHTDLTVD